MFIVRVNTLKAQDIPPLWTLEDAVACWDEMIVRAASGELGKMNGPTATITLLERVNSGSFNILRVALIYPQVSANDTFCAEVPIADGIDLTITNSAELMALKVNAGGHETDLRLTEVQARRLANNVENYLKWRADNTHFNIPPNQIAT